MLKKINFNGSFRVSKDLQYSKSFILGKHLKTKKENFPWHASASDSLELEMFVDPDEMIYFSETFMLHPPDELPMLSRNVFEFAGGRNLEVLITPNVIKSDQSLNSLDLSDRSCYFEDEFKLKFFKIYTQRNCEIECFAKYALNKCNCLKFDVIRNSSTRVCGITDNDMDCFLSLEWRFNYIRLLDAAFCSCLPKCDSITYNFEIRENKLNENEWVDKKLYRLQK